MRSFIRALAFVAAAFIWLFSAAQADATPSRIKDIVAFEGVRENQLVGYGLVVGLNGTGDSLRNSPFTRQSLQSMLERLGVNTRDAVPNSKNVAAVMVTAQLPPFAAPGSRIDVAVSAMGDARSLQGGTLVVTALLGADGQTYAVSQGQIATGAISAGGASGSSVTRGVPTAGRIAGGATVERESGFQMARMGEMRLTLRNPDFTTARRIADAVNSQFPGVAAADNPTIVTLRPPASASMADFISRIENLPVEPDTAARVVVDEASGTIVMGSDVRISTVAVAQGSISITVDENPQVSQPAPESLGQTVVTPQSSVRVNEDQGRHMMVLRSGASLATLVNGLNQLGVTPREIISILLAIRTAGALQADIEVM